MKGQSVMKSVAKALIGVMLIAPLHGCLVNGSNVRMDGASIGDALNGFMKSATGSGSGKKEWPFIPTDQERRVSEYSYGVMGQAMTGRTVRANYPAGQSSFASQRHAEFKAFMASAPQMSEWTGAQAVEYSNYLSDLIPLADAIIAADEQGGANTDAAMKKSIVANKGVIKGNVITVPPHSAVSLDLQAFCADRHFKFPTQHQYPTMSLVPASFAQTVPNDLATHLRNASNSYADKTKKSARMHNDEFGRVLWAMTEAGNFTKENQNIFQPDNEKLLNNLSPGLYKDFTSYNQKAAIASGQKPGSVYGSDRDDIFKASDVTNLPVNYRGVQNYPSSMIGQNTYYHIKNDGFNPQFTFYNAGATPAKIDLSRYGLVNDGSDRTQKLIIAGLSEQNGQQQGNGKDGGANSDALALAKNIAMDIERLSISKGAHALAGLGSNPAFLAHQAGLIKQMGSKVFKTMLQGMPMVSAMIAFNEGVSGKDFVSGRNMTGIERGLAFLESAPIPGAKAEAMASKMNWTKIASAINSYGNTVRGSLYWEGAGFGLEAYKQTLGNTGDYLSNKWNDKVFQTEAEKALIFINGSGAAIDKLVAQFGM